MAGFPWTAYGVSQAFYYKKATAENTKGGIKYESIIDRPPCAPAEDFEQTLG